MKAGLGSVGREDSWMTNNDPSEGEWGKKLVERLKFVSTNQRNLY